MADDDKKRCFAYRYSRYIFQKLSAWFQNDTLKPPEVWEAMKTSCKADAKLHLDDILGEW